MVHYCTGETFWCMRPLPPTCWAPVEARPCTLVLQAPPRPQSNLRPEFQRISKIAEDGQEDAFQLNLKALFNENMVAGRYGDPCDAERAAASTPGHRSIGSRLYHDDVPSKTAIPKDARQDEARP